MTTNIEQEFDRLYQDMLDDITRCLALEHPEKENVESCYWIARNYWTRAQEIITKRGFTSDEEEIAFFKVVKPKFASHIEYFSLLSEGLQFVPPKVPFPTDVKSNIEEDEWEKVWQQSIVEHWTNEVTRGQRHYEKYKLFLDDCTSENCKKDPEYFLLRKVSQTEFAHRRSHNRDTELFTPHEEILTAWEGFKLYKEYIKRKVHEPAHS